MAGAQLHGLDTQVKGLAIGAAEDRNIGLKGLDQLLDIGKQAGVSHQAHHNHMGSL